MLLYEDAMTLSLLYHLNSEPWLNTKAYEGSAYRVDYKEMQECVDRVALPATQATELTKLLAARTSCRRYKLKPLSLSVLATLLTGAYGIVKTGMIESEITALFRTTPSAGGLFPLELYLFTQHVQGVADGVHHYAVRKNSVELMKAGTGFVERYSALIADQFVREANVVVFIAAVFGRTQKKYGPRGYRYILLEAGHVAQNLCLLATEQGLGSLCMGGFMDSRINRFLGLDGIHEAVIYSVGIGHPDRATEPLKINLLDLHQTQFTF